MKSWVVSLGTGESTGKRSGLKVLGSSHSSGDLQQGEEKREVGG